MPLKLRSPRNLQPFFRCSFFQGRGHASPGRAGRRRSGVQSNRGQHDTLFFPLRYPYENTILLSISRALLPEGVGTYVVKRGPIEARDTRDK